MSSSLEFEGKNVEKAIATACKELNIKEKQLQHEVLSYGSTGIFGLVGTKKARIRVIIEDKEEASARVDDTDAAPDEIKAVPVEKEQEKNREETDLTELELAAREGKIVLQEILRFISDESHVSVEIKQSRICYSIKGGHSGILIGKRGQTLDAIQYLVEKIINKSAKSRIRLQIDVEGYLETRKDSLKELAIKLSNKVKKTGKPVTVGHMSAHDRRIIHIALKNDKKVRTQSMGDGFLRKIVIFPKRRCNPKKKNVQKQNNKGNNPA